MSRMEGNEFAPESGATRSGTSREQGAPLAGDAARGRAEPGDEQIRRRAYELYQSRGGEPGSEVDDWLAAERELRGFDDGPATADRSGGDGRRADGSRDRGATGADTEAGGGAGSAAPNAAGRGPRKRGGRPERAD